MTQQPYDTSGDSGEQMRFAMQAMARHVAQSEHVDRSGWTTEQWADDAERLMNDLDGSVMSLVNGHVLALLRERDELRADLARKDEQLAEARRCGAMHPTIFGPACALPRNHAEDHLSTTGCAGSEVRWQTAEARAEQAERQVREVEELVNDLTKETAILLRNPPEDEDYAEFVVKRCNRLALIRDRLRAALECPPDCERDHTSCTRQRWTEAPRPTTEGASE